ncbi:UNVERIFIED_CONTAM: hypothetical protein Sangu_3186200 [Sesamum angustifolium]|uniref:Uncharacterized protein n=1 Tax=Sesamum angustifolium TaxID=2727405 RepID=A0AAW2JQ09_9LAMI
MVSSVQTSNIPDACIHYVTIGKGLLVGPRSETPASSLANNKTSNGLYTTTAFPLLITSSCATPFASTPAPSSRATEGFRSAPLVTSGRLTGGCTSASEHTPKQAVCQSF